MWSDLIVPCHIGIQELPSVIPRTELSAGSFEAFGHNSFDDPLCLAVGLRMLWFGELLGNAVRRTRLHKGMICSPSIFRSIVRIGSLYGKGKEVDGFLEVYSGCIGGFIRQDVCTQHP